MTTTTTTTAANPALPRPPAARRRSNPRRTLRQRLGRLGFWTLVLGLLGLNAWRAWETRPAETIPSIQGLINKGRLADAEHELRRYLALSTHDGEARMMLARLLAARKDYLACAEELHKVEGWSPSKSEALFLEGQSFKYVERVRDAESAWRGCLEDDPLHPNVPHYFHGAARELIGHYVLEGRIDEARSIVWKAYEQADAVDRPSVLIMRLRLELERIAHDEAAAKLRQYVTLTPDDWDARRALALEEQSIGNAEAAVADIAACLKARPNDAKAWRNRLEILNLQGDHDGLTKAVAEIPKAVPEDPELWKYRGLARGWAGDHAGASEAFAKAAALNPYEPEYAYKLGISEQRLGRRDVASREIRRSQQLRDAYEGLHDAYMKYLELAQRARPDPTQLAAVIARIASRCEALGMKRESEAWRQVSPSA